MKKICILCLSLLVLFLTPVYAEEKYTPTSTNDIDEKAIMQMEQKNTDIMRLLLVGLDGLNNKYKNTGLVNMVMCTYILINCIMFME